MKWCDLSFKINFANIKSLIFKRISQKFPAKCFATFSRKSNYYKLEKKSGKTCFIVISTVINNNDLIEKKKLKNTQYFCNIS